MQRKTERVIWIVSLLAVISFFYLAPSVRSFKDDSEVTYYDNLLKTSLSYLNQFYVDSDKVSIKDLYYGAMQGIYAATKDPYTSFLEPKVLENLMESIHQEFEGIGAYVGNKNNRIIIITPIESTPAYKVGLKSGDLIMKIEEKDTEGMKLEEAVSMLRGPADSKVKIEVYRKGIPKLLKFAIERKKIEVPSVRHTFIEEGKIAYIKITTFGDLTEKELENALEDLKKKGFKKLIIDLRYNPGGSLSAVVSIADMFLKKGLIVYTVGKKPEDTKKTYSDDELKVDKSIPMVILINKGSASASEIFAGAMKDRGRGIVLGEKSYGKGTVQNVFNVLDKDKMVGLKITIAKYYTPGGYVIEGNGIEPNIKVSMPEMTTEEEIYMSKIIEDKLIDKFVEKNPEVSSGKEYDAFKKSLDARGLKVRDIFIKKLIREEQNTSNGPKLIDLDYDTQLKKAIEVVNSK